MKRYFILSFLAFLAVVSARACADPVVINYYVFHLYDDLEEFNLRCNERFSENWKAYADTAGTAIFELSRKDLARNPVWQVAVRKKDREMQRYLRTLAAYYDATPRYDGWEYPSKEELAKSRVALAAISGLVAAYKGTRFRSQYLLLAIRIAFAQKDYAKVIALWKQRGVRLPNDVYREQARNYYAGALFRKGHLLAAADIYGEQHDWLSLRWMMNGRMLGVAGLRRMYQHSPNSDAFYCLLQSFVNDYQESADALNDDWSSTVSWNGKEVEKDVAAKVVDIEMRNFFTLAGQVVKEGKSKEPALWMSAAAMLAFYNGDFPTASRYAEEAVRIEGTDKVREQARIVRLVISTAEGKDAPEYRKYLLGELQWLDSRVKEERESVEGDYVDGFFYHIRTRLYYQELPKLFGRWQRPDYTAMLIGHEELDADSVQPYYQGDFVEALERMPIPAVERLFRSLSEPAPDDLEAWMRRVTYRNNDFYNDYIGTRYLNAGAFAEALPYLERVPLPYLSSQSIAFYASQRTYKKEAWADPQWTVGDEWADTAITLWSNQKMDFCRDVLALEAKLSKARGEKALVIAYQLGSYLYQASPYGRCWYLSNYYYDVRSAVYGYGSELLQMDDDTVHPFLTRARQLLQKAAQSKDASLRVKALFALAYIPDEKGFFPDVAEYRWDEKRQKEYITHLIKDAPQLAYYGQIAALSRKTSLPAYISSCAIYRTYLSERK